MLASTYMTRRGVVAPARQECAPCRYAHARVPHVCAYVARLLPGWAGRRQEARPARLPIVCRHRSDGRRLPRPERHPNGAGRGSGERRRWRGGSRQEQQAGRAPREPRRYPQVNGERLDVAELGAEKCSNQQQAGGTRARKERSVRGAYAARWRGSEADGERGSRYRGGRRMSGGQKWRAAAAIH